MTRFVFSKAVMRKTTWKGQRLWSHELGGPHWGPGGRRWQTGESGNSEGGEKADARAIQETSRSWLLIWDIGSGVREGSDASPMPGILRFIIILFVFLDSRGPSVDKTAQKLLVPVCP